MERKNCIKEIITVSIGPRNHKKPLEYSSKVKHHYPNQGAYGRFTKTRGGMKKASAEWAQLSDAEKRKW